jgi:acetyltransferase-like isoleucine patch superfamily enzyme
MSGAVVGRDCNIGDCAFVEDGAVLGDGCTVKNGTLVFSGVTCEDSVFLGPNVLFTNDMRPRAALHRPAEELLPTTVRRGASLGAGVVVVCGTEIGQNAFVAAGAVVTRDVPAHALVAGNPARQKGWVCACGAGLGEDLRCPACGTEHALTGSGLAAAARTTTGRTTT